MRWCYDVPQTQVCLCRALQYICKDAQSLVSLLVGCFGFSQWIICARRCLTLASALGKTTFGRRKIRDGRHSFCEWDPVMQNRVLHHSRPQWEQTSTISNFAPPKRGFGHSAISAQSALRTGICQNKCVKCQFLDLPSPTLQGYI